MLKGTTFDNDVQNMYLFPNGLEADIHAKVMAAETTTMSEAMDGSWEYFRKPRPPDQNIMAVPDAQWKATMAEGEPTWMQLDAMRYGYTPFAENTSFLQTSSSTSPSMSTMPVASVTTDTGQELFQEMGTQCGTTVLANTVMFEAPMESMWTQFCEARTSSPGRKPNDNNGMNSRND